MSCKDRLSAILIHGFQFLFAKMKSNRTEQGYKLQPLRLTVLVWKRVRNVTSKNVIEDYKLDETF